MRGRAGLAPVIAAALAVAWSLPGRAAPSPSPPPPPPPVLGIDIKAEIVRTNCCWFVQVRNVGQTIAAPYRAEFHLIVPGGASLTGWTLNGWSCAPGPSVSGPADVACAFQSASGAWPAGTILSNQLFHATAGATARACVRAVLKKPNAAGVPTVVGETSTANNSACAP